ncbi:hypothetical protein TcBrA4_0050680 [Trypanosoma cruzi]|nr:hypothetical protein TcBrA4_0050680 [Trypanosoma cruzi]
MRYRQIPACGRASVGLVLSKGERVVATATPRPSGIAAIRYDPVVDVCAAFLSHSASPNARTLCGWCAATGACVATSLAASCCPRGSFRTPPRPRRWAVTFTWLLWSRVPSSSASPRCVGTCAWFRRVNLCSWTWGLTSLLHEGPGVARDEHDAPAVVRPHFGVFFDAAVRAHMERVPDGNYTFAAMPFVTAGLWGPGTSITYARLPERTGQMCFASGRGALRGLWWRWPTRPPLRLLLVPRRTGLP